MEYSTYAAMTEKQLVKAWASAWNRHEESYLQGNTQGCVDADWDMEKIDDILYCKYDWSNEMLKSLSNMVYKGLIKVN